LKEATAPRKNTHPGYLSLLPNLTRRAWLYACCAVPHLLLSFSPVPQNFPLLFSNPSFTSPHHCCLPSLLCAAAPSLPLPRSKEQSEKVSVSAEKPTGKSSSLPSLGTAVRRVERADGAAVVPLSSTLEARSRSCSGTTPRTSPSSPFL
jgi:hypothetical protein